MHVLLLQDVDKVGKQGTVVTVTEKVAREKLFPKQQATPLNPNHVLLWKDVKNVGRRGEIVEVKPGFARNYLFPQQLASKPTPADLYSFAQARRKTARQEANAKGDAETLAKKIEEITCTIEATANEEGGLFGSITPQMIADAVKKEGVTIEPKLVVLEAPIKELGVYTVKARLHPEVTASFRCWVVEEKDSEPKKH